MLTRRTMLAGAALCAFTANTPVRAARGSFPVAMPDAAWRRRLGADAYAVLRRDGTERPYSSPLEREHRAGRFSCAGCAAPLFSSTTKFDSGTGWPSFYRPLAGAVAQSRDDSIGVSRTEIHCATCGGHLGHVFNDGPRPTGLRYCMNGVAMRFTPGEA